MKVPYVIILLACIILHGNGDDSEEGTDDDSSEEQVPAQTYCPRCHPNPDPSSTVCGVVGGIYRTTFRSECHLRQFACVNGNVQSRVVHYGACMTRPPVTTRVPTTRRIKPTPRVTPAPTTRRTTPATTTTMAPVMTTPCPDSCDLVLEPVCTTVGTYQSECTFNLVRCRGIIASTENHSPCGEVYRYIDSGPVIYRN